MKDFATAYGLAKWKTLSLKYEIAHIRFKPLKRFTL